MGFQIRKLRRVTISLLTLASFLTVTNGARILGLFTSPAASHFRFNYAILESLHKAGHQVTMIAMFPLEKRKDNFTYIKLEFPDTGGVEQWNIDQLFRTPVQKMLALMVTPARFKTINQVVRLPEIQAILRSSSEKLYDVLLVECFRDHEFYLPIAENLKIPVIGTSAIRSWRWADQTIGVPNNPAIIPGELAASESAEMSFIQRVENLWNSISIDIFHATTLREHVHKFYREYFPNNSVGKKDMSLIFYNNHVSFLSRPSVPNAIDVGGIHLKDTQPLPNDLQTFIDEALHGVVLFSLGTVVNGSSMSVSKRNAFLTAFSSIPQRVIWKLDQPIENFPKKIYTSSWLPQRDILEHENVIAFISHCGINGVYEAIVSGTPIIAMPLFADQPGNAALLQYRKVAVNLDFKKATKETILNTLDTIVNDTSYYQNMQQLSRAFKDRPMTPQQSVVYWTEYVLRHKEASHYLKALGTDMPLYKYFMLDLITFALLTLIFAIFIIYRSCKTFRASIGNKCDHSLPSVKKVT